MSQILNQIRSDEKRQNLIPSNSFNSTNPDSTEAKISEREQKISHLSIRKSKPSTFFGENNGASDSSPSMKKKILPIGPEQENGDEDPEEYPSDMPMLQDDSHGEKPPNPVANESAPDLSTRDFQRPEQRR